MQVELPFHSKSHRVEKLNPFRVGFRRSLKISVIIAYMPLKVPVIIARTPQEEVGIHDLGVSANPAPYSEKEEWVLTLLSVSWKGSLIFT